MERCLSSNRGFGACNSGCICNSLSCTSSSNENCQPDHCHRSNPVSGRKPKKRRAGKKEKQKKERKGYEELSVGKLTLSNLGRNKKRTAITIAALGMTGIFFITVATLLSCVNPKTMTEEEIRSDVCVSINNWIGDKMHPEREIQNIQKTIR